MNWGGVNPYPPTAIPNLVKYSVQRYDGIYQCVVDEGSNEKSCDVSERPHTRIQRRPPTATAPQQWVTMRFSHIEDARPALHNNNGCINCTAVAALSLDDGAERGSFHGLTTAL